MKHMYHVNSSNFETHVPRKLINFETHVPRKLTDFELDVPPKHTNFDSDAHMYNVNSPILKQMNHVPFSPYSFKFPRLYDCLQLHVV